MSVVAYHGSAPRPGLVRTAWLVASAWAVAAVALFSMYAVALAAGVFAPGAGATRGSLNEWPFPADGWWALATDASAVLLALLVVTAAVAWRLRTSFEAVSEPRLALVLLFTGGLPLVAPLRWAAFGFVVVVLLGRTWISRQDERVPPRSAAIVASGLALVIVSYGLLHPVWIASARTVERQTNGRSVELVLQNASRLPITIETVDPGPIGGRVIGREVRVAPGAAATFFVEPPPGGCATVLPATRVHYRLAGLTLSSQLTGRPTRSIRCP